MLKQHTRTAILELRRKGQGIRAIARALQVSRTAVKAVIAAGTDEAPRIERDEKADPWREQVLDLWVRCEGHRGRVHEELTKLGADVAYSTLTAWLKRQGLGETPRPPAGQYHFDPGEEMQHDSSPYRYPIGGVEKRLHIVS